ncbi:MAG TPA: hypothetical protein VIW21_00445 [Chthoniobacterales bacterium]|jgi:hypothetical protein
MKDVDPAAARETILARLLRAAAAAREDTPAEMPFGFDTRVIAHWRAHADAASLGIVRLLHRVALGALAIIVVAAAGAYLESDRNGESDEPFANEYAIADTAIQDEIGP